MPSNRREIIAQPRGARPKVPSITVDSNPSVPKVPPSRRARPLPALPPGSSPQSLRSIRPLPRCPLNPSSPSSSLSSLSSSPSSSSLSLLSLSSSSTLSPPPSPTLSTPSPTLSTPRLPTLSTPPSLTLLAFVRPNSNSDCMSVDDEDADIMEPYQRIKFNKSTNHRWKTNRREPTRVPTKKWVTETKGQRITMYDYNNVRNILRTL